MATVDELPLLAPITLTPNRTGTATLQLDGLDRTGSTWTAQVRAHASSAGAPLATFTCTATIVANPLGSPDLFDTIITCELTPADTAAIDGLDSAWWALKEVTVGGDAYEWLSGPVTVALEGVR